VESGDEQVLTNMNKHISYDKALIALKHVKDAGMFAIASFLVGFPGETVESAQNTLKLIFELKPQFYTLQSFQIRDLKIPILAEADKYSLKLETS
jgi:p-methyltransferase